jgi:hypothetical protein
VFLLAFLFSHDKGAFARSLRRPTPSTAA